MNLLTLAIILVAIPHSFAGVIEWGSWTRCTVSCGGGSRSRTAICETGGNTCKNDKGEIVVGENQTASCNLHPCTTGVPSSPPPRTMTMTTAAKERNTTDKSTGGVSTRSTLTKATGKMNATEQQNTTSSPKETTNLSTITENTTATAKPTKHIQETQTTYATHETHDHAPNGGGEGTSFEGQMKMDKQFSKDLEDKNSKAFKDLKTKCETAIKETLSNKGIESNPDCYKFTEGSVVIHYRISTKTSVGTAKLSEAFSSSVRSGPLSALSVSDFSIARSQSDLSGESDNVANTQASNEIVEPYLYFLYGFGGMMGLAFVFIVLAVIKRKIKPSPDVEEEDLYESYFNTPVTNKKMPNDDFTTKKQMQQTFDYPTDENKINKRW